LPSFDRTAAKLAGKNWRRMGRDKLVAFEHELRENAVADEFINLVAAEVPPQFVFEIVVAADIQVFSIGREHFLFVQDHQLSTVPRLARFSHITPEMKFRFIIAASDKVIARRLGLEIFSHRRPLRFYLVRDGSAADEQGETGKNG